MERITQKVREQILEGILQEKLPPGWNFHHAIERAYFRLTRQGVDLNDEQAPLGWDREYQGRQFAIFLLAGRDRRKGYLPFFEVSEDVRFQSADYTRSRRQYRWRGYLEVPREKIHALFSRTASA